MRFLGAVVAWVFAGLLAYCAAVGAGQWLELNIRAEQMAELGLEMPLSDRLASIWNTVLGTYQYLGVILAGFLIAFFVAGLVKAAVPVLALLAYPIAGGAAVFVALRLMEWKYELVPLPGGELEHGILFHVIAGVIGGVAFEIFRPRDPNAR